MWSSPPVLWGGPALTVGGKRLAMRIGLFTDTYVPDTNGVVTVVRLMERELTRAGHDVYVFAPAHPSVRDTRPEVFRFRSFRMVLYKGMRVPIPYNRRAYQVLRSLDIVHSHDPFSIGLLGFWAARRYEIPHVHTYHALYTEYRKYLPPPFRPSASTVRRLSRLFCNRCDAIIAPSHPMERELRSYGITVPIYAIPFGLDEEEFGRPVGWNARQALGLPEGAEILLYVGRLAWEKNVEFLIRMFKKLAPQRPSAWLVIAGNGPYRPELEALVAQAHLAERVKFTGYLPREHLIDLYKQATLFVFASKTETQGLVVMESMMAGVPPVALGAMGVADLVESGKTGILVDEDEETFAQACLRLLDDEPARRTLGQAAQAWATAHDAQASTARLLEVYQALRKAKPARREAPGESLVLDVDEAET